MPTVVIEITYKCPLNCPNCPIANLKLNSGILPLAKFAHYLDFADRLFSSEEKGEFYCIISGGEPSIVNNLREYVRIAQDRGYRVTVVSTGFNPETLLSCNADLLEISLDYSTAEKHDTHRGFIGLFSRATRVIRESSNSVIRSTYYVHNYLDIINLALNYRDRYVFVMPEIIKASNGEYYKRQILSAHLKFFKRCSNIILPRGCNHLKFITIDLFGNCLLCPFCRVYIGKITDGVESVRERLGRWGRRCPARVLRGD